MRFRVVCCLLCVTLLNDVPQYEYLLCRPPAFSISCLFFPQRAIDSASYPINNSPA